MQSLHWEKQGVWRVYDIQTQHHCECTCWNSLCVALCAHKLHALHNERETAHRPNNGFAWLQATPRAASSLAAGNFLQQARRADREWIDRLGISTNDHMVALRLTTIACMDHSAFDGSCNQGPD